MRQPSNADGTGQFLTNAGRIPLLRPDEELHLGKRVQALMQLLEANPDGPYTPAEHRALKTGRRAKERMIAANLRMVVSLAKKYTQRGAMVGMSLDDLIQEGCIGLTRGVEKFDPTRGYKFSTYSYWWIRQGIARSLGRGLISLPIHVSDALNRVAAARRALALEGIERPTFEQLEQRTALTAPVLRTALEHGYQARVVASLDAQMKEDGSTLLETIAGESEDHLTRTALWDVAEQLKALLPDEMALCELRHVEGETFNSISSVIGGVSRAGAKVQVEAAQKRLRRVAGEGVLELLAC
ncbi:sigma-70 family RNA polymerase sigma factor [Cyanobium sp. WKJ7-Wakatipu]|uniref:sigma-70 family RNA polymerase sigma factor n=1 Tax=Cyanobium sp. WKJ7-Wakatipu TaxID=2823726 RepID=UPI0020CF482D|nr:sigma-70 family RNA polymerase sigma factor [Cyanobium sp. WKJ7-Wakatipu]MCP9782836.1 sigma-70 family RNA polymerase sigma factor [Cyanobium sp. WKJ7-Wakatipu]